MALVECPACGNMISENASSCPICGEPIASKMSGQVDSGTENFSVEANNRIELSAKTQAEIGIRTNRLSTEGKTVVSVNTSVPQPFNLGVTTVWSNDVTIVWNASLSSEQYKKNLYDQAKGYFQSGKYEKAQTLFDKVGNFSDAREYVNQCATKINEVKVSNKKYQEYETKLSQAIGPDTRQNPPTYLVWGSLILIGIIGLIMCLSGGNFEGNIGLFIGMWVLLIVGIIPIVKHRIKVAQYIKKYEQYHSNQ